MRKITLSTLDHTWLIDIDGTLLLHNGYKIYKKDSVIQKSMVFLKSIPKNDYVILLTSRSNKYIRTTLNFLKKHQIKFDLIVFNLPVGERILINDKKPGGLMTSYSINIKRNNGINTKLIISKNL